MLKYGTELQSTAEVLRNLIFAYRASLDTPGTECVWNFAICPSQSQENCPQRYAFVDKFARNSLQNDERSNFFSQIQRRYLPNNNLSSCGDFLEENCARNFDRNMLMSRIQFCTKCAPKFDLDLWAEFWPVGPGP